MNLSFRTLNADEIECRIASIQKDKKGLSLLLYKDARVDQNILDEVVGPMNWQRSHQLIGDRLYCTVSIWDDEKNQWISKQDVGTESYTEKEKGQASDSYKRACFNWGIGRELYSAPFIWITNQNCEITNDLKCYDKFEVVDIAYNDKREITSLAIVNIKTKKVAFSMNSTYKMAEPKTETKTKAKEEPKSESQPQPTNKPIDAKTIKALKAKIKDDGIDENKLLALYNVTDCKELTEIQYYNMDTNWEKVKEKFGN